jgi:hypothetical protein
VYDDNFIVGLDPRLKDPSRWGEYWTKDYFNGGIDNLYRPLVTLSYFLQWQLHGDVPWAFHLVNWLLHAAVSAQVAELARRMTRSPTIATIAGLLFAVHPIHVEAVANIVGRAELMCALGVLAALILFFRPLTNRRVLAICGCMLFAILSKEQGLLTPLMLIAAIPLRRQARVDESATSRPLSAEVDERTAHGPLAYAAGATPNARRFSGPPLLLCLLTCWLLASYMIFRESILKFWWDRSFLDRMINPMVLSAGVDRALMPLALLGRYVALLIAPLRLNPDYGGATLGSSVSWSDPYLYLGACALVVSVVACLFAVRRRRRDWLLVFCIVCFALIYGMIGNILTLIGTNFGERLMYLPSVFFCIVVAALLARIPSRRAMIVIVAIVASLLTVRTVTYAGRWNDPPKLFRAAIERHPHAVRLYLLLSEELHRRGDADGADEALARGRAIAPDYYRVWLNSAHLAMAMRQPERALHFAREAHRLNPTLESETAARAAAAALNSSTRPATSEQDFFP